MIRLEATTKHKQLKAWVLESDNFAQDRDRLLKIPNRKPIYQKGEFLYWEFPGDQIADFLDKFKEKELDLNDSARELINKWKVASIPLEDLPRYDGPLFQSKDGKIPREFQEKAIRFSFEKKCFLIALQQGLGKQQPISEPVLTPNGWKTMGDLKVGDFVIGSDGRPKEVIKVFPQTNKKTYLLTCVDGSSTRCGPDHLWRVYTHNDCAINKFKVKSPRVHSTQELLDKGLRDKAGNLKFRIPMCAPIEYPEKEFSIPPYLLGVILGDGHINKSGGATITSDWEICKLVNGRNPRQHQTTESCCSFKTNIDSKILKDLGLALKRSHEKFIPTEFLLGSVIQRKELLAGLLDTDGFPMADGGLEFSSTSEQLMDGVIDLVRSLGGVARNKVSRQTHFRDASGKKKPGKISWRVNIKTSFNPFKLSRKANLWVEPTKYPPVKIIKSIEQVDDEESVCILIDSPDHLYVTKDYILTHNSLCSLVRMGTINPDGQTLIVCPRGLRDKWQTDVWNILRKESTIFYGNKKQRTKLLQSLPDQQIIIATFETAKELIPLGIKFEFIIVDEIHIPGGGSALYKNLYNLLRENPQSHIWGLSGTPMRLTLENLYDVCKLVDPVWAGRKSAFLSRFQKTDVRKKITKRNRFGQLYSFYVPIRVSSKRPEELKEKLGTIMYRVTRDGIIDFADAMEVIPIPMTPKQEELYQATLEAVRDDVANGGNPLTESLRCLQVAEGSYTLYPDTFESGKVEYLLDELKDREGEKACIWFRYLPGAKLLHEKLKNSVLVTGKVNDSLKKYAKWALNGVTNSKEEEEFYKIKEKYKLKHAPGEATYYISTYSLKSGMGLDLDMASTNYFMSFDWSPASLAQAKDRIIRLCQVEDCVTKFLVSSKTIEPKALGSIIRKLENMHSVVDGKWSTEASIAREVSDLLFEEIV